jgi:predicted phage terminase large subunit-like protein
VLEQLERLARVERRLDRILPAEPPPEPTERLVDYVPAVSPRYLPPHHLAPYTDAIERSLHEPIRLVVSVPPRHTKTDTTLHAFSYLWQYEPTATHGYVTYERDLALSKSRRAQGFAKAGGHQVSGSLREWYTAAGGSLLATSIGGPLTGHGVTGLLVIDDPVKNRAEAESPTYRQRAHDWVKDVAFTRLEPGASCIVLQTRWHPDDLAGRLIREGWPSINLRAVTGDTPTAQHRDRVEMAGGTALWPEVWPLLELEQRRRLVGEYTWAALFQGSPRPRGATMFGEPTYYDRLPDRGYRVVHGVDLAYSARTASDWSICVTMLVVGNGPLALYYVVDVRRHQLPAPQFAEVLKLRMRDAPAPMWFHCSGTEKGSGDFMRARDKVGPRLRVIPTQLDKFTRALPASEAWNAGRIMVPRDAPWLEPFLAVIQGFTGINDDQDDDADALGSGYAAGQAAQGGYSKFRRHKGVPSRLSA